MPLALLLFNEAHVYEDHFDITYDVGDIQKADLVVFPGGADWNPHLYGKIPHPRTSFSAVGDARQMWVAKEALRLKKKIAGHCRGAQLLCILNGDKLVQHVDNHFSKHEVVTKDKQEILVNSIHHQMMIPTKNYELLAWSKESRSSVYETTDRYGVIEDVAMPVEPEAVYFKNIKGLAVQWHPEWMGREESGYRYYQQLIKEYLL